MPEMLQWGLSALGLVAFLVLAVGGFRSQNAKQTIDTLEGLLDATQRSHEHAERECTAKVAELSGRVGLLESTWGHQLAKDIAPEVARQVSAEVVAGILEAVAHLMPREER